MKLNRSIIINIDEVINSNPNGDPTAQGGPRIDNAGYGYISAVARRKKYRLIVENKDGEIWKRLQGKFTIDPLKFGVAKSKEQDQDKLSKLSETDSELFLSQFWDVRVFGATMLYDKTQGQKFTGVVQTGMGRSVSVLPTLTYGTVTVSYGVKENQGCTMAPDAIKVIPYAIYKTVECVDGFLGDKTKCTDTDIEIFKAVAPYVWTANRSQTRQCVRPIHIHCLTFKNPLDMRFDREIELALTPTLKPEVKVGIDQNDFIIPTWDSIKSKYEAFITYEDLAQVTL